MIISRKRFNEEVDRRVQEELERFDEMRWRNEREREQNRVMKELELRLIAVEKKNGIDHPSHKSLEFAKIVI